MNYETVLSKLYHLVVQADGDISESELEVGKKIFKIEGLDQEILAEELRGSAIVDKKLAMLDCIEVLKGMDRSIQIRCIAWMCVVADIDWEIDEDEWAMIYDLYASSLKLPLNEIVFVQSELTNKLNLV
jgi:uncharacterized tellurite resistance protein B-like protein